MWTAILLKLLCVTLFYIFSFFISLKETSLNIWYSVFTYNVELVLTAAGPEYWYSEARSALHRALHSPPQGGVARNVVLLVGDGMGLATVTAARILRGQQLGMSGEEYQLAFEKFPNVALAKVSIILHFIIIPPSLHFGIRISDAE